MDTPVTPGPCAKQTVVATLITRSGQVFEGTNWCRNAQPVCPREIAGCATGEGYEMCKDICGQDNHAEVNAIASARRSVGSDGLRGSKLYLSGHSYACRSCTEVASWHGVQIIITGRSDEHPPMP